MLFCLAHLTINDLKNVLLAIWDARSNWCDIGLQLDIRKPDLDAIQKECGSDLRRCLTEMLTLWLKQLNPPPTWNSMISALKQPIVQVISNIKQIVMSNISGADYLLSAHLRAQLHYQLLGQQSIIQQKTVGEQLQSASAIQTSLSLQNQIIIEG